jgi:hypothetical protein
MSEANSTPAAGGAATPTPNTEGEAPSSEVESGPRRSTQVRVEVKGGMKSVVIDRGDKTVTIERPAPKAGKPAPAAGESSALGAAGKADGSVPATDGKGSTPAPQGQKSSPGQPPKSSASAKPGAPTTEPEKKPDEKPAQPLPLSKAYAALLDREAKITTDQNQLKADRTAFEAERSAWNEAKELGKTSKLKAVEKAFGWTLTELQQEFVDGLEGTLTPEQIAERTARKTYEDLQKADTDRQTQAQKDRDEQAQRDNWARVEDCTGKLNTAFVELSGELDAVNAAIEQASKGLGPGVTPLMIITWWAKNHEGQFPTDPHATLKAYEAELRGTIAARGYAKAPAAPAAAATPEPEKRAAPTVRPKGSASITSEDAGDVPIRANRKESATERAARLVRERIQAN